MIRRDVLLNEGSWSPGLTTAIRALLNAERRTPTPADAPPLSVFPMTKAARAALSLSHT